MSALLLIAVYADGHCARDWFGTEIMTTRLSESVLLRLLEGERAKKRAACGDLSIHMKSKLLSMLLIVVQLLRSNQNLSDLGL